MAGRRPTTADLRIAARVKAARESAGLTQAECAHALRVQYQQYAKYEVGQNRLTGGMLLALADLFRMPVGKLFEPDTGRPMPEATADALRGAGAARGLPVSEVARRLVEAAARDGLIDAILDDGVRTPSRRRYAEAA